MLYIYVLILHEIQEEQSVIFSKIAWVSEPCALDSLFSHDVLAVLSPICGLKITFKNTKINL